MSRSAAFREIQAIVHDRTMRLTDTELVVLLSWFMSSDEPLRGDLGIRNEKDFFFVIGFQQAWIRFGKLTWKQRAVARRMIEYGAVQLQIREDRFERTKQLDAVRPKVPFVTFAENAPKCAVCEKPATGTIAGVVSVCGAECAEDYVYRMGK